MKWKSVIIAIAVMGAAAPGVGQQRPGGNGPLPGDPNFGRVQSSQGAPEQPRTPMPTFTSEYTMTFGAMAKSLDDEQFAFSVGRYSAPDAASESQAACERISKQQCTVFRTFQNACATLAWPASLGKTPGKLSRTAMALALTSEESIGAAIQGCEKLGGAKCKVGYMACASPVLKVDQGIATWSAVAIDPVTLKIFPAMGLGYNAPSARAAAYDSCQRDAATTGQCHVLDHFPAGECRYLAQSIDPVAHEGGFSAIIRERPDPDVAKAQCEKKAGGSCRIVWQGCS